jgi:hypothetical protein
VLFIKIKWIPYLTAFALIGSGIHALWRNDYAYVIAIPLGWLVGFIFWEAFDYVRHAIQWRRGSTPGSKSSRRTDAIAHPAQRIVTVAQRVCDRFPELSCAITQKR